MFELMVRVLVIIWTIIGLGLCCYLVFFPAFMKRKIKIITDLLERIAKNLEKR